MTCEKNLEVDSSRKKLKDSLKAIPRQVQAVIEANGSLNKY